MTVVYILVTIVAFCTYLDIRDWRRGVRVYVPSARPARDERCPGCYRRFGDHPQSFDDCIREVLSREH